MRIVLIAVSAFLAMAGCSGTALAGTQRPFEGKDLFALQWVSDPQIRPDGTMVAYVRHSSEVLSDSEAHSIWIVDVGTRAQQQVGAQPGEYSSPRWSPDGARLAYLYSPDSGKPSQLFVYALRSGVTTPLTNGEQAPRDIAWSHDGGSIAFDMLVPEAPLSVGTRLEKPSGATWADPLIVIDKVNFHADGKGYLRRGYSHVFVVPASGGAVRQITTGPFSEFGPFAWSQDGASLLLAANRNKDWEREPMDPSGSHPRHRNIYRLKVADGTFEELDPQRVGSFRSPVASPDGSRIAYLGFDDRHLGSQDDRLSVVEGGSPAARDVTPSLDRPIDSCFWSANSRSLYCSYTDDGATNVAEMLLDGRVRPVVRNLSNGQGNMDLPESGGEFSLAANGTIAYTGGGPAQPAELYIERAGKSVQLTHLNETLLAAVKLGTLRPLAVTSSFDQRRIGAWEITPPDFDASKKYPLILEIHGGPYYSDGPLFSTEYQLFAAAGYIVVYSNPRGSTSYGEAFANLIQHHYPEHDFDDLMSVVDAAIDHGNADPDNLFITGQSGGGILTAWTVGGTQRFRAAASQSPAVDWTSWVLTTDVYAHVARNWFEKLPWEDHETYWKQSPISRIGNVTTPTLMLVGGADLRTPPTQAEEFYQALQLKHVPTELIVIPGQFHAMFSPSQMAAQVSATLAWFDRYKQVAVPR